MGDKPEAPAGAGYGEPRRIPADDGTAAVPVRPILYDRLRDVRDAVGRTRTEFLSGDPFTIQPNRRSLGSLIANVETLCGIVFDLEREFARTRMLSDLKTAGEKARIGQALMAGDASPVETLHETRINGGWWEDRIDGEWVRARPVTEPYPEAPACVVPAGQVWGGPGEGWQDRDRRRRQVLFDGWDWSARDQYDAAQMGWCLAGCDDGQLVIDTEIDSDRSLEDADAIVRAVAGGQCSHDFTPGQVSLMMRAVMICDMSHRMVIGDRAVAMHHEGGERLDAWRRDVGQGGTIPPQMSYETVSAEVALLHKLIDGGDA